MGQTTPHILMIRPKHFGFNEETAKNNSFQQNDGSKSGQSIADEAVREFDQFAEKLTAHGIDVVVIEDTDEPVKPDAVFPNNWVSFHEDGMVLTYPMYSSNRRVERRPDIINALAARFKVKKDYTLEHYEEENIFLEGTGSLILDRINKIAYANLSPRTDLRLFDKWCVLTGYQKVHFLARDRNGNDIYHTNVMMALGDQFCVICLECITESPEKDRLLDILTATGKEVIDISLAQVESFAGNMLQVENLSGKKYLVMSATAYKSLTEVQIHKIKNYTDILTAEIPVIEKYGGGSVRCMMAEIFLPLIK
ncbi:MAG: amidinotransferase [Saprospiraceae bacterium]|nr:amidinotransferase [Saprospiraceae bacterium]